jgi:acetyl-CoA carboxylase carboxyltransferase component
MGEQEKDKSARPSNSDSNSAATARLTQIKDQVQPKPRRHRKQKTTEGPADWSDVWTEFTKVRRLAQTPKAESTGYRRHKAAGKLWVRERVELLVDRGSFREIGSASGTATWTKANPSAPTPMEAEKEIVVDFTPSNNVQGTQLKVLSGARSDR